MSLSKEEFILFINSGTIQKSNLLYQESKSLQDILNDSLKRSNDEFIKYQLQKYEEYQRMKEEKERKQEEERKEKELEEQAIKELENKLPYLLEEAFDKIFT